MERPTALFFDLDDTLLDGFAAMQAAWAVVLAEVCPPLGCEPERLREAIRREATEFWRDEGAVAHWRVRLEEARERVIRQALLAEGLDPGWAPRISRRYGEEHRARLQPFADTYETLERLRTEGFRLGLLTNGPAALQRDKVERFGLARYFDVIVIEGEFGAGKPSPLVFGHALRSVGAEPHRAWMVGDNLYADIGGAKASGLTATWIHRGRLKLPEAPPALPDRSIAHLSPELWEALELASSPCQTGL
ncbi:Pyrimidine 5'-nucleotidase YjjG [bacterium HR29]|jgi:putative hydrolase of the HAD superfamily|nr:Pyrimidine 5'-nucleotidase YjjG [bacterium HR29]